MSRDVSREEVERVRLQKYLSHCGVASRRASEDLIRQRRVVVNGKTVEELGAKVDPLLDSILVDGEKVRPAKKRLYLFHKPVKVVTTLDDPQGRPCVGDYLNELDERVYPVGRLDFDVCGLLLLTNDGDFANRLLHPRYEVTRKYWAIVENEPSQETLDRLLDGVEMDWGVSKATQVKIRPADSRSESLFGGKVSGSLIELSVAEGKKHFVKKLLEAVGHPVIRLARVSFGEYELKDLKPGEIYKLR